MRSFRNARMPAPAIDNNKAGKNGTLKKWTMMAQATYAPRVMMAPWAKLEKLRTEKTSE